MTLHGSLCADWEISTPVYRTRLVRTICPSAQYLVVEVPRSKLACTFRGELEAAVLDGGAHAVLGFLDLGVGQSDDGEAGQAVGQVHFDVDFLRVHAGKGSAF